MLVLARTQKHHFGYIDDDRQTFVARVYVYVILCVVLLSPVVQKRRVVLVDFKSNSLSLLLSQRLCLSRKWYCAY